MSVEWGWRLFSKCAGTELSHELDIVLTVHNTYDITPRSVVWRRFLISTSNKQALVPGPQFRGALFGILVRHSPVRRRCGNRYVGGLVREPGSVAESRLPERRLSSARRLLLLLLLFLVKKCTAEKMRGQHIVVRDSSGPHMVISDRTVVRVHHSVVQERVRVVCTTRHQQSSRFVTVSEACTSLPPLRKHVTTIRYLHNSNYSVFICYYYY